MKIVIVEDEIRTREGLAKLIENISDEYKVIGKAADGRQGISIISQLNPDIVITDIVMPYISGIDMIEHLQKRGESYLFVILTGYADFNYAQRCVKLKVFDYLLKPINRQNVEMLMSNLKIALESKENKYTNTKSGQEIIFDGLKTESIPIRKTVDIISKNYRDPLSLESIANQLNITPEYLSGLFHSEMGVTFSTYLKTLRINKAKTLLLNENMKIYEVANAVGYPNVRYFCHIFKEVTGVAATQYVQSNYKA